MASGLLQHLNPALPPVFNQKVVDSISTWEGSGDFGRILSRYQASPHPSGGVEVPVSIHLSPNESRALGGAVDEAAALEATRAVVIIGGRGLVVDVARRRVLEALSEESLQTRIVTGVDAVVLGLTYGERKETSERQSLGGGQVPMKNLSTPWRPDWPA